jgi:cytochrome c-type biogenesis protein CcmH
VLLREIARSTTGLPIPGILAACLLAVFAMSGATTMAYDEAEYLEAAETVLCDCGCHPQSVADCACGRAAELREEMRSMVEGGMTGDEIIAFYVAKHGEQILVAPEATGFNLFAWLGPFVLLLAGGVGILVLVRRWSSSPDTGPAVEYPTVDLPADDPYVAKLRREIEDLQ